MRKIFAFIAILILLFAIGCVNKETSPPSTDVPAPVTKLTQVEPEKAATTSEDSSANAPEAQKAEEPAANPTSQYTASEETQSEVVEGGIGSRLEGNETVNVDQNSPKDSIEIKLNVDKTMSESSLSVVKGTTIYWKNYDSWPHQLRIEQGKGWEVTEFSKSDRLMENGVWSYTFNTKGTFLVRDIFAGKMRMNVTVT